MVQGKQTQRTVFAVWICLLVPLTRPESSGRRPPRCDRRTHGRLQGTLSDPPGLAGSSPPCTVGGRVPVRQHWVVGDLAKLPLSAAEAPSSVWVPPEYSQVSKGTGWGAFGMTVSQLRGHTWNHTFALTNSNSLSSPVLTFTKLFTILRSYRILLYEPQSDSIKICLMAYTFSFKSNVKLHLNGENGCEFHLTSACLTGKCGHLCEVYNETNHNPVLLRLGRTKEGMISRLVRFTLSAVQYSVYSISSLLKPWHGRVFLRHDAHMG